MIVTERTGREVAVRWRMLHNRWRCQDCGLQRRVQCIHTFSAGVYLAQRLLGLTALNPPATREDHTP